MSDFKCIRCRETFGGGQRCKSCGVDRSRRVVRHYRRNRPIGGKRGRNSGTTNTAKKKK